MFESKSKYLYIIKGQNVHSYIYDRGVSFPLNEHKEKGKVS